MVELVPTLLFKGDPSFEAKPTLFLDESAVAYSCTGDYWRLC